MRRIAKRGLCEPCNYCNKSNSRDLVVFNYLDMSKKYENPTHSLFELFNYEAIKL